MVDTYSYDCARAMAMTYFHGEEMSTSVYLDKYALRDRDNTIIEADPSDMHRRLAREFARIDSEKYGLDFETRYQIYFDAMDRFGRIVPQGSVMAAVGNPYQTMSASNCVVEASPEDSISGIFRTAHNLAQLYKRRCGAGFDLSSLRPEGLPVNNAARTTTGAWSFADLYSDITRKIGQCIARGERVLTRTGLKPIEEVDPETDSVWTKVGYVPVSKVWQNGSRRIFNLQTTEGFSIRASEDHFFLSENDGELIEKRLGDFEVGDSIVLIPGAWRPFSNDDSDFLPSQYVKKAYNNSNRLNKNIRLPEKMTIDLAYFLGLMYGDGSIEYDRFNEPLVISIACAHAHPKIQEKVCQIIRDVFGIDPIIKPGDGAVNKVNINSKLICHLLQINGILKGLSNQITMPIRILRGSSQIQMAFLAGFFDADGTNGKSKKGYTFSTTSLSFARDIQTVLMANGIVSKRHAEDRGNKGWKTLYSVTITGKHAQEALAACIAGGTFPAAKIYEVFVSKTDNYLTPFKAKNLGVSHSKYAYIPDNSQYVSAQAYRHLRKDGEPLDDVVLLRSSVLSITDCGEAETFDLELPKEHMFWCEGFYVHNSGRRGALMITMDVHHPDVLKFATMKHDLTKVTGANISLRLSDEFLKAVSEDTEYELRWPCNSPEPKFRMKVSARRVWDVIVDSATKSAEPGLILWTNAVRTLPAHCYPQFESVSTNPCSEIILSASDSCRLITQNLTAYVRNAFEKDAHFDWDAFKTDTAIMTQMGDNLVDLELELIAKIIKTIQDTGTTKEDIAWEVTIWEKLFKAGAEGRRTGLGTHGLADTLAQLRLRYDSDEANEMIGQIYKTFKETIYGASIELAKARGPFPVFDYDTEKDNPFIQALPEEIQEDLKKHGRRNISMLTQAPTGSVSIISKVGEFDLYNVSSGVEPVFRVSFTRRKKVNPEDEGARVDFVDTNGDSWQEYKIFSSNAKAYLDKFGLDENTKLPEFFVNSDEIDWTKRVRVQATEQSHIDHSISSTINLPAGTPNEVIGNLYLEAWKQGLKGVTVYVDGSRDGVLVTGEKQALKCKGYLIGHYSEVFDEDGFRLWDAFESKYDETARRLRTLAKARDEALGNFEWEAAETVEFPQMTKQDVYDIFAPIFNEQVRTLAPKRPKTLDSETHKIRIDFGNGEPRNAYVTISFFPKTHRPYEVLVIAPYFGLEEKDLQILELTARTTSMNLRHGVPIPFICEQLDKIGGQYVFSLPTNIARILRYYIDEPAADEVDQKNAVPLEKCPGCGQRTYRRIGATCGICTNCPYSGCG